MHDPEMFLYGFQRQPAFRFAGSAPFRKFIHQADRRLHFLIVLDIHDGIPATPVLCQKDRSAHGDIMQDFAVIQKWA